ncbi:MAG TPA: hypothetical protein VGM77_06830 [Gemmatimonadales bacterium]
MIEAFRDMLAECVAAKVRFLVVGAHALAVHGVPRSTVDLDIWIDRTPANVEQLWQALTAFGAPLGALHITKEDFTRPEVVVQFGLPPYRIDILTDISGVTFDEAWADRVDDLFGDVRAHYIGRRAFVQNKRASGRLKDLADLESLGDETR